MKVVSVKSMAVLLVLLVITLFQACGSSSGGGSSDSPATVTVTGTVVDANGVPVRGAVVTITSDPVTVITDTNGNFSAVLEPGDHSIVIRIGSEEIYEEIYKGPFTVSADTPYSFGQIRASFAVAFEKTVGSGDYDIGSAVLQTLEGDYIIVGTIFSDVKDDKIYMIKIDEKGEVLWEKSYIEDGSQTGEAVYQTSDGGFIIAGSTIVDGKGQQMYLMKTDKDGVMEWENDYGGFGDEDGKSVQQTADRGYIITGSTTSLGKGGDVYLVKTKAGMEGEIEWEKHYGGDDIEWGESVQQTLDKGYIVTGYTKSFGNGSGDIYLIRTDSEGKEIWLTPHAFGGMGDDHGESVQQTTDGGFIIAGSKSIDPANDDVYLIKTDADGNELWNNNFGGKGLDLGYAVRQTTDKGYIIAGVFAIEKEPDVYHSDICLIKTDAKGKEIWPTPHTFGGINNDFGLSAFQTKDGGYIITGSKDNGSDDDVYIIKTDMYGNTE